MQVNLFLFSLRTTQSNIYGGAFLQKKLTVKVINYLCKKAPPQTFDWVLNTAVGNTVKKSIHFKGIYPVM